MAIPAEQAATDAFLRGLTGASPIETHISAVYVGVDEVWKLRKAVRLGFVDFTPLAERERTARREVELNAPNAPGLYRCVLPITRGPAGVALDGDGEVVDWVVRMARIPDGDFLDRRPDLDLTELADTVAAMHGRAVVVARDQAEALRQITMGNAQSALTTGLEPDAVRAWLEASLDWLAAHSGWLRARGEAGFVRRGHGDLHLGNLCLWHGHAAAFDALEFDEHLATLDVGYDLAFLLMDLDVRRTRAAANAVLNRYVARTGDAALVAGLPMFLSERAMIRAHVQASRFLPLEAVDYLARAQVYLRPSEPLVIAIGGLPGAGKSTLARALAPGLGAAPGALVLRSDEIRKRLHGVAPETRLGEAAYGASVSSAVFETLAEATRRAVAGGHSVIADATFMAEPHRALIRAAAGAARFVGIWLDVPADELRARVAARTGDASDAGLAVLERALGAGAGAGGWTSVAASDGATALAVCQGLAVA